MTYKILMVVYRNTSLSPTEFRDHYENIHIPLMKRLTGKNFPISHTRHYLARATSEPPHPALVLSGSQSDFDYDCLTELTFESEAGFGEMSTALGSRENANLVAEDCAAFMDPTKTKIVVLGEVKTTLNV